MQSRFSKVDWFSIVSIPFVLDAILTNGENVEQKLVNQPAISNWNIEKSVFHFDVTNWHTHLCPLYKSVCKYFANDKNWKLYARKLSAEIVRASFEKFLEGFVPKAKNALAGKFSEKERSIFWGHILFFAFRHGLKTETGIPFGSEEKRVFLNSYLGGFNAPFGTTEEFEKLLEANFG